MTLARSTKKRSVTDIQTPVAYIRVSSDEQADADRDSLPAQRKAIEAYCKTRGWQIARWYEDAGVSAHTDNIKKRPAFHQMIIDLRERRIEAEVIVTHTLDRFARNLSLAITTLAEMSSLGITYSSITESDFDHANPDQRMHLQILAMFAEYFSEKLSQHTKKGKRGRADAGLYNGDLPYGYRNPDAGTIRSGAGIFNSATPVAAPDEAAMVVLAFERYVQGASHTSDNDIAKLLNARGARTRNAFADGGRAFSKDTINKLLQNPFYAGWVLQPTGEGSTNRAKDALKIRGKHNAIISDDLFEAAQRVRASRAPHRAVKPQPERMKAVYPLAGLVVCQEAIFTLSLAGESAAGTACSRVG